MLEVIVLLLGSVSALRGACSAKDQMDWLTAASGDPAWHTDPCCYGGSHLDALAR